MENSSKISGAANSLARLLREAQGPGQLLARARAHAILEHRLLATLPDELARHVRVARVRDDCLVLAADSPAWATRLRLQGEFLTAAADRLWPTPVNTLAIIVSPRPDKPS